MACLATLRFCRVTVICTLLSVILILDALSVCTLQLIPVTQTSAMESIELKPLPLMASAAVLIPALSSSV